jgi:hypothetical protein
VSDRLEHFESELARLRPRSADAEWSGRIAAKLTAQRRSDRLLIGAMTLGAMAACVIVSLLVGSPAPPAPSASTLAATGQAPRLGNELQAFALAGQTEFWK